MKKKSCNTVDSHRVVFKKNEFEIALCTFNRPQFVKVLLPELSLQCLARNIQLRIVDASNTDETEQIVRSFNKRSLEMNVLYTRVPSDTIPGFMQMQAINTSDSKYVWVYADARRVDFDEFDRKIFPIIKKGIDLLVFYGSDYSAQVGLYTDLSRFVHSCIVQFTCTGCSIYNREIFECFRDNLELKKHCDDLFKDNYAFSWMGYSLYALAQKKCIKTYFSKVLVKPVLKKKRSTWMKRFYACWIDDMIDITDNLPEMIRGKDTLLTEIWRKMELDRADYCYLGRTVGDLNRAKYEHYLNSGVLERICANKKRMRFYACSPIIFIYLAYPLDKFLYEISCLT